MTDDTRARARVLLNSKLDMALRDLVEQWRSNTAAIGPHLEGAAFEQCANQVDAVIQQWLDAGKPEPEDTRARARALADEVLAYGEEEAEVAILAFAEDIEQPLREQIEQLKPAASERDSIAALGKVEGLIARVAQLEQALGEALDAFEDAGQYKGGYLSTKHGDADEMARLRAVLDARETTTAREEP